jgi:lysophospholipid acyltransferase 7
MRMYCGFLLGDSICTSAGFGAYPKELEAKCGHGNSKSIIREFIEKPEGREYDFETITNINVEGVEKCLTLRETLKHWNRCIQYWLAIIVYKQFPSQKYRTLATSAVSAFWHGSHAGYYFCLLVPAFYFALEDLYMKVFDTKQMKGAKILIANLFFWILKTFALGYMIIAFQLKEVDKIWLFYSSVYHFAYFFWAILFVFCLVIKKMKVKTF